MGKNRIQDEKAWILRRIKKFIEDLENSTNPYAIESNVYTIKILSERSFEKMHLINKEGLENGTL